MEAKSATVKCIREVTGEYVTAGQTYRVELTRREAHFRRLDDSAGTFMPLWRYKAALADGSLADGSLALALADQQPVREAWLPADVEFLGYDAEGLAHYRGPFGL